MGYYFIFFLHILLSALLLIVFLDKKSGFIDMKLLLVINDCLHV